VLDYGWQTILKVAWSGQAPTISLERLKLQSLNFVHR